MNKSIIEQCYQKSIELLLKNSNKFGLMASSPNKKSKESLYTNIFGRDTSISKPKKMAFEVLENLAKANKINNWEFNEWFHGITKKPMGMKGQSWNAGMFILAYHYLKGEVGI